MPSGAKKRKAAKRKKEQEQQQSLMGVDPPDSPTLPASGLPHSPQVNGAGQEEDDLISQSSKRSDSGSESASPTSQDDREFRLELDGEGEKGSDSAGPVDAIKVLGGIKTRVEEHPIEPLTPEKTEAAMKKTSRAPDAELELGKEELLSEHESVTIEDRQPEKNEHVSVGEEVPPSSPLEPKQSKSADEALEHPSDVLPESINAVASVEKLLTTKAADGVLPPVNATSEQPHDPFEARNNGGGQDISVSAQKAIRATQLKERASWMGCCGIFDLMSGASK